MGASGAQTAGQDHSCIVPIAGDNQQ
jgi:hypothetical protein